MSVSIKSLTWYFAIKSVDPAMYDKTENYSNDVYGK